MARMEPTTMVMNLNVTGVDELTAKVEKLSKMVDDLCDILVTVLEPVKPHPNCECTESERYGTYWLFRKRIVRAYMANKIDIETVRELLDADDWPKDACPQPVHCDCKCNACEGTPDPPSKYTVQIVNSGSSLKVGNRDSVTQLNIPITGVVRAFVAFHSAHGFDLAWADDYHYDVKNDVVCTFSARHGRVMPETLLMH